MAGPFAPSSIDRMPDTMLTKPLGRNRALTASGPPVISRLWFSSKVCAPPNAVPMTTAIRASSSTDGVIRASLSAARAATRANWVLRS